MGGEDAAGKIPGEFEAEVKQALNNIGAVLKAAGMSPDNVVSVQVYLTDGATFERMNAVYQACFKDPRPTRTTVVVAKLDIFYPPIFDCLGGNRTFSTPTGDSAQNLSHLITTVGAALCLRVPPSAWLLQDLV
jgi:enamine deaminase RidA (YjgF/YER057c/UK114 family)